MDINPFTPGFGSSPLVLVGREEILNEFRLALNYPGREAQSTILIAERGCGKTVLLNRLQLEAAEHGWVSVQEDGRAGLTQRLTARLARHVTDLSRPGPRRTVTNITVAGVGAATWEPTHPAPTTTDNLRDVLEALLDLLASNTGDPAPGVLVTIDELHTASLDEMNEVGNVFQHHRRADRPIALACAGLPGQAIDRLFSDERGPSFVHRSYRPSLDQLEHLATGDVRDGLQAIAAIGHRHFTEPALDAATEEIDGFPYMLQSVGFEAWRAAGDAPVIDLGDVRQGLPAARDRLARNIAALAIRGLSSVDVQFLQAMAIDPQGQPSKVADIAERLGVPGGYVSRYRDRLINAGVIRSTAYGHVELAVRGLRDHLLGIPHPNTTIKPTTVEHTTTQHPAPPPTPSPGTDM